MSEAMGFDNDIAILATSTAASSVTPNLWRLNLRSGGNANQRLTTELCIRKGVIGIGWGGTTRNR
jgi:hypothetical protein